MICDEHFVEHETKQTAVEGTPSTKINRRSFLTASLRSAADRTLDEDRGKAKILLNDFAVSEVDGFEDIPPHRSHVRHCISSVAAAVRSVGCSLALSDASLITMHCRRTGLRTGVNYDAKLPEHLWQHG